MLDEFVNGMVIGVVTGAAFTCAVFLGAALLKGFYLRKDGAE